MTKKKDLIIQNEQLKAQVNYLKNEVQRLKGVILLYEACTKERKYYERP